MIFAKFPEFPLKDGNGLLDYGAGSVDIYGWVNPSKSNADSEVKTDFVRWCFRDEREQEIIRSLDGDIVYFEPVTKSVEAAKVIREARKYEKR